MSFIGNAIGSVLGGITGATSAARAANRAGDLQYQAAMAGVDEQRRQFDQIVELMAPFVGAGTNALGQYSPYQQAGQEALTQQRNLIGLGGAGAQEDALRAIQNGPQMNAMIQQGENAILQNASATGGLRGGNTQAALAQFRPQLLNQLIEQQYTRLGGLAGTGLQATNSLAQMGQASAGNQASMGSQTAANIGNLLQQGGAAQAGGVMAMGSRNQQAFGSLLGIGGLLAGAGLFGGGAAAGSGANLASMGGGQGLLPGSGGLGLKF